ncbi:MAG: fasciclin domain-containing protein [Planctomycetes bacterium]|nr:fasciclin domain-containing protein [Planctomycetota bacterium]
MLLTQLLLLTALAPTFRAPLAVAPGDGCASKTALAAGDTKSIVDTAVAAGSFTTLAKALQSAKLVDALQAKGPFTVFAPTDEAFAKLPKGTLERLLRPENAHELAALLTYHVVPGNVAAKDVVKLASATTLNGQRVDVRVVEGGVRIDDANVVKTDITCSNGVIHVIDRVLVPQTANVVQLAEKAGTFGTLVAALDAAGLKDVLAGEGPFTVFAPSDEAFAKLPKGTVEGLLKPENKARLVALLKFHVVSGRVYADQARALASATTLEGRTVALKATEHGLLVGGANVTRADLEASNGVIHVIDAVLMPK